jgi:hypothetical protein
MIKANTYAMIAIGMMLCWMTTRVCATEMGCETAQYSKFEFTYCYDRWQPSQGRFDRLALYYNGLGHIINTYIEERIRQGLLPDTKISIDAEGTWESAVGYATISQNDEGYAVYMNTRADLKQLVQLVNYLGTEHWQPFTQTRDSLSLAEFLDATVPDPSFSFFDHMQVPVLQHHPYDHNLQIVYKPDALWYFFDGTFLEIVEETPLHNTSNSRAMEGLTWQGNVHSSSAEDPCLMFPLRETISSICGGPQYVWQRRIAENCGCDFEGKVFGQEVACWLSVEFLCEDK